MEKVTNLDVTVLEPRQKHPTIFAYYDELQPGTSLIIHNDHDPKPLYYQLLGERGNVFQWEYIEKGPDWWRVKITKNKAETEQPTVGQLAASDYRKAQVFKKYGLDFCCGGKKTVEQACAEKNILAETVLTELKAAEQQPGSQQLNFNDWDPGFLADFIVNNHHAYVKKSLQPLQELATKVAKVHGENHPETKAIATIFNQVAQELSSHLGKEEQVLFPYIKSLVQQKSAARQAAFSAPFGTVQQPVSMMEHEHEQVGKNMAYINQLTNGYSLPAGACSSYTLLYKWLHEFEDDLLQHVHLENNILFPKAIELEKQIA
jgi:regulator of cell morphogenesis and NO signaling